MIELPDIGDEFAGKYTIRELLGQGGNAAVFRATDVAISREVAVKIVLPVGDGYPPQVVGRFMREGRIVAGLVDPHNITMFDFGETEDGTLYMVFEFVDGRDLGAVLADEGCLQPNVVAHILDQVLQGLEEAHRAGVLHRDVKPANILVYEYAEDPYRIKLLDFGIARPASAETGSAVTTDGMVVGTPRYMAPEQMLGGELEPASDLFSLGLVAYEMLLGRRAFDGKTPREIARQQFAEEPLLLPAGCAPPEFCRLIERMMARNIDQRPRSAQAVRQQMLPMKAALAQWAGLEHAQTAPHGSVGGPRPPTRPPQHSAQPRRSGYGRRFLGLVAVALLVGAGLAALLLTLLAEPEQPARTDDTPDVPSNRSAEVIDTRIVVTELDLGAPTVRLDASRALEGCGAEAEPGRYVRRINTYSGSREWVVYLPESYDGETELPVVLMLHRSLADGAQMLDHTGMSEVADENGFIVLAPTSPDQFAWRDKRGEIDFLKNVVSRSNDEFCLDLRYLYVVGEGRGGEFADDLTCHAPLSAVAVTLSGQSPDEGPCPDPDRRTPRMRIYGKADRYVPAEGGKGCLVFGDEFLSAEEIEEQWKVHHGCRGAAKDWLKEPGGRCKAWKCDVPFIHCATTGGHDWPSAPRGKMKFPGCEEDLPQFEPIEYGPTVWKFLSMTGRQLDEEATAQWRDQQ